MRWLLAPVYWIGIALFVVSGPAETEAREHPKPGHGIGAAPSASYDAWLRLPERSLPDHREIRLAKRGIKIGKIIDFFSGNKSDTRLSGSSSASGRNNRLMQYVRTLGIRGLMTYALLFMFPLLLLVAAYRFLRSLLRGLFVSVRDAEVIDARMTRAGTFRPIVLFEDRSGTAYRALAEFETRKDPRGSLAAVEISGGKVRVVRARRGLGGLICYILGPILLSILTLMAAYYLDTTSVG